MLVQENLDKSIKWPSEPWVCTHENAKLVIESILREADNNPSDFAEVLKKVPATTRKLLWHFPLYDALRTLFEADKAGKDVLETILNEDHNFSSSEPGGDEDAWNRMMQRLHFLVAMAARKAIFDPERLAEITIVLDWIQGNSAS